MLGKPAFRLDASSLASSELPELVSAIATHPSAFVYSKIATINVDAIRLLGSVGFYVADVNTSFRRKPYQIAEQQYCGAESKIVVRQCLPQDIEPVLAIAGSAFKYTRFHLDPLVSNEAAHRIKREWIRNYTLRKRGDALFVALVNNEPAGFLASLVANSHGAKLAVIDLIAVGDRFQGQGAGVALVDAFGAHYHCSNIQASPDSGESLPPSIDVLQVGTQAANIPSMRLYEKLGYQMFSTEYVVHGHFESGAPLKAPIANNTTI